MKTKIIILLIILVLIGIGGVVFLLLRKEKLPEIVSFSDLEIPSVSLTSVFKCFSRQQYRKV